jgi:hypothetical protein
MENRAQIQCILKKKKNNFIVNLLEVKENNASFVIFNKTCGSLPGISGSKKYTSVALESLGKGCFLKLFKKGYKFMDIELILTFKIDKFVRSFVRGLILYGKNYIRIFLKLEIIYTHNGIRARKQRRV